jgi:ribosome-associated toxin RatA of RatAB toxin-antitoxin module
MSTATVTRLPMDRDAGATQIAFSRVGVTFETEACKVVFNSGSARSRSKFSKLPFIRMVYHWQLYRLRNGNCAFSVQLSVSFAEELVLLGSICTDCADHRTRTAPDTLNQANCEHIHSPGCDNRSSRIAVSPLGLRSNWATRD